MSSAALIKDGILIAACEEERFNREKYYGGFPEQSILYCCRKAGITPADIDVAVFYMKPWLGLYDHVKIALSHIPYSLSIFGRHKHERGTLDTVINNFFVKYNLTKLGFRGKFYFLEHHLAHSGGTFFVSPFEESAILTVDLAGEIVSTYFGVGKGNKIFDLKRINYPHSLGVFYGTLTEYLGYNINGDEYKVMGLASYGEPSYYKELRDMIKNTPDGEFKLELSYFTHHLGYNVLYSKKYVEVLGEPCRREEDLEQKRFRDIACSGQKVFEEVMDHMVLWLKQKTGLENICLAGGCALNSKYNGKLIENGIFKRVYIQPAAYDSGCALGAAFYWWNQVMDEPRSFIQEHAYWGPEYSNSDYENAIKQNNLQYCREEDITKTAARLLSDGEILGWFQGQLEWGPRALGNRSILADPRRAEMKDIINAKVKFREPYRPFAPSILEEKTGEYFNHSTPSPFMLLVYKVLPEKRNVIPAVTHIDGTGRLQSVNKNNNLRYWQLIKEFEKITGVPVILNTSFNRRGEPIVCSPQDAVNCFINTDIDYLVLGDYLCWK